MNRLVKLMVSTQKMQLAKLFLCILKNNPDEFVPAYLFSILKLRPDYESWELGIGQSIIVKTISSVSGKSEKQVSELFNNFGDLGLAIEKPKATQTSLNKIKIFVASTLQQEIKLTVISVFNTLQHLQKKQEGTAEKKKNLTYLLRTAKPIQAKYIVRFIEKNLKIGAAEKTMQSALARAFSLYHHGEGDYEGVINQALCECPNYKKLIDTMFNMKNLKEMKELCKITPGVPCQPMLAKSMKSIQIIFKDLKYEIYGLRGQIHFKDGVATIFSRNLENMTQTYPDIVNYSLYLQQTLHTRRQKLRETFKEETGKLQFATSKDSENFEEIEEFLLNSIKMGCEGLMIKTIEINAQYEPAKRSFNWLKLKKDYLDNGLSDTFDLVPIGAQFGTGKRKGFYGSYLLACYNEDLDQYETTCKIGTGFSDENLEKFFQFFQEYLIPQPLSEYKCEGVNVDVWFRPAIVWEIKSADIQLSFIYSACSTYLKKGVGLRFPRLIKVREDKRPNEATTSSFLYDIYKQQAVIASNNKFDQDMMIIIDIIIVFFLVIKLQYCQSLIIFKTNNKIPQKMVKKLLLLEVPIALIVPLIISVVPSSVEPTIFVRTLFISTCITSPEKKKQLFKFKLYFHAYSMKQDDHYLYKLFHLQIQQNTIFVSVHECQSILTQEDLKMIQTFNTSTKRQSQGRFFKRTKSQSLQYKQQMNQIRIQNKQNKVKHKKQEIIKLSQQIEEQQDVAIQEEHQT